MENYQKDLQSHCRQLPLGTMSSSSCAAAAPATAMSVAEALIVANWVKDAIYRIDKCQNQIADNATWEELNIIKNKLSSVCHTLGLKDLE